jgi:hypothetical protein
VSSLSFSACNRNITTEEERKKKNNQSPITCRPLLHSHFCPPSMTFKRHLLLLALWLLFFVLSDAFCPGTFYYRSETSGGIVALPKTAAESPTSNPATFPIPGTSDSDSGIASDMDLLCYIILPTSVRCINMTDGTAATNSTGVEMTNSSTISINTLSTHLVINTNTSDLYIWTFEFFNNSITFIERGHTSMGEIGLKWALKSFPPGIETVSTAEGTQAMSRYRFLPGFNIISNPSPPMIPTKWIQSNAIFYFIDELFNIFSLNGTTYQYSTNIGPINDIISTDANCEDFIILNASSPSSISYFHPNTTISEQVHWQDLFTFNNDIQITSSSWTSYIFPYQDWMAVPMAPIEVNPISAPTLQVPQSVPFVPSYPTMSPIPITPEYPNFPTDILTCPQPGPTPLNLFYCDTHTGLWTSTGSYSSGDLTLSTDVFIPGTLSVSGEIIFNGLKSVLNVSGCVLNVGSISLILSKSELSTVLANKEKSKLLMMTSCPTNNLASVPIKIKTETKKCEKISASPQTSANSLTAILKVDSKQCNLWWIILASVLGAVLLIGLIIIFVGCTEKGRKIFRPFHGTESKVTRRITNISLNKHAISTSSKDDTSTKASPKKNSNLPTPTHANETESSSDSLDDASEEAKSFSSTENSLSE